VYVDVEAAGCPNTCRHCGVSGHYPYGSLYSLQELRAIRKEWGPLWVFYEPTAHPDFPETIDPSIEPDLGGWLVTNGFGLARREDYPAVFQRLDELGIQRLSLSLHGLREHHDWFVCRQGAFGDIVTATRRAREAGFHPTWQVYLDRGGLDDVAPLVERTIEETGEPPAIDVPFHRVSNRLWRYERLRPTLQEIRERELHRLLEGSRKNRLADPERLTAAAWLEVWRASPDDRDFRHPCEPPTWPPEASYEHLTIHIDRERRVYVDPECAPPIHLGHLSEGKEALLERLDRVHMPPYADLRPDEVKLDPAECEELHPIGYSLRYKEISKARRATSPDR
jgi:hypothetical protein